jgi:hypothetical protein
MLGTTRPSLYVSVWLTLSRRPNALLSISTDITPHILSISLETPVIRSSQFSIRCSSRCQRYHTWQSFLLFLDTQLSRAYWLGLFRMSLNSKLNNRKCSRQDLRFYRRICQFRMLIISSAATEYGVQAWSGVRGWIRTMLSMW